MVRILALLLLAGGPLGAAPAAPPSPPLPPEAPAPPALPHPPAIEAGLGDTDPCDGEIGDLNVEVREHGPAAVSIVRGPRSRIGVTLLDLTPELRELYTGSKDSGVLVSSVETDGPAAKAGLRVGDVIVKIEGESVTRAVQVSRAVRGKDPGQKVTLEVRREKAARTIEVAVAERKRSRHEIRIPDLGGYGSSDVSGFSGFSGFCFGSDDWEERISEKVERALERTREKLRRIEERLRELERRWQTK